MPPVNQKSEMFSPNQTIPYSGEYEIVDENGNPLDYQRVSLNEGEQFPSLADMESRKCFYRLAETCGDEEQCEVIGGPTPDTD